MRKQSGPRNELFTQRMQRQVEIVDDMFELILGGNTKEEELRDTVDEPLPRQLSLPLVQAARSTLIHFTAVRLPLIINSRQWWELQK